MTMSAAKAPKFSFFGPKTEIAELIIKLVPTVSVHYPHINCKTPILLNLTSTTTVDQIKNNLQSILKISASHFLLIYCGTVLTHDIPLECFEPLTEIADPADIVMYEDDMLFKSRIYLSISPPDESELQSAASLLSSQNTPSQQHGRNSLTNSEAEAEEEARINLELQLKLKKERDSRIRKGERGNGSIRLFDLQTELGMISCGQHYDSLEKAGFTNEGAFANITEAELTGPGLWLPRRASVRILTLADTIRRRLGEEDKDGASQNHHGKQVEAALLEAGKINTVSSGADGKQYFKKADIRRAWEESENNRKRAEREKTKEIINPHAVESLECNKKKIHSDSLQDKIDEIRRRAAAASQLDDDDNVYNRPSKSAAKSPTKKALTITGSKDSNSSSTTGVVVYEQAVTTEKFKPKSIKYSKMSSPGGTCEYNCGVSSTESGGYCCTKHEQTVKTQRESFIAQRKTQNQIDVELKLSQLDSYVNGYIPSSTLFEIARAKLAENKYNVSEDVLSDLILVQCEMDLHTQQKTFSWINSDEMRNQHSVTILPVKRYSAQLFVTLFCDLLERLDREYWK